MPPVFYALILVISGSPYNAQSMTAIPGFTSRGACDSAGASFMLETKGEVRPRYYCVLYTERDGNR